MEGFRIRPIRERIDTTLIEAFRGLPVANVSDCMNRLTGTGALVRMHREGGLVGPAFTVRTAPGDNLMLHKALDMAAPGDVIVVDAGGDSTNALIGELMVSHAKARGIAGVVIDGAVRDRDVLQEINLPVFARAVSHRGPYKNGPGEIGFDVTVGGMIVQPGDLILGDGDGLLAVPRNGAGSILECARKKQAAEAKQLAATLSGQLDCTWVDRTLRDLGCEFLD